MYCGILYVLVLFVCVSTQNVSDTVLYDAYFGKPVTAKRSEFLANAPNASSYCLVAVRPCRKDEGRRVDGTCTNPKYPSRGASLTPLPRLLPPMFGPGSTLRPAKDGFDLPSARLIRTTLIGDGMFRNHHFSTLATHFQVFCAADNADLLYLLRYLIVSTCCVGNTPNRADPACIPIPVPADDPYLRETGIRCLNLTRVFTYQDFDCLPRTLPAERITTVTPLLDLSIVYGNNELRGRAIRKNEGGLLAFRMEGEREVPEGQATNCLGNQLANGEVICYNYGNLLPGIYLTAMWFFREHNRLARQLSKINPCWDDEKLYATARQINIAQFQYIFYYELIPELLGHKNALSEGIVYDTDGFVNDFNPAYEPGVIHEYVVGTRWFHNYQSGKNELYRNETYVGTRLVIDDVTRSGILAINNTEAELTQGCTIQPADKFDYVMDPQLAEKVAGNFLAASDLPATDFMRGRDAGFPPYNRYRELCGLKAAKHWEDFYDTIDKDKVEYLRRLYDDVDDVELMVAIYAENILPGAHVGPTLYCIMVHNLLLWRRSDRYFFEHGDHPTAFNLYQLNEVRRTSIARILCDNGDGITYIQPAAFFRRSAWNKPVDCASIPGINLNKWMDRKCYVEDTPKTQDAQTTQFSLS